MTLQLAVAGVQDSGAEQGILSAAGSHDAPGGKGGVRVRTIVGAQYVMLLLGGEQGVGAPQVG